MLGTILVFATPFIWVGIIIYAWKYNKGMDSSCKK